MASDPNVYRRRALTYVNRAAECGLPAVNQKFADLAIVWLMLAAELEERVCRRPAKASGFDSKGSVKHDRRSLKSHDHDGRSTPE